MSLTPLSLGDTCDSLFDLLVKKVELYELDYEDTIAIIDTFKTGWIAAYMSVKEPGQHPELEKFISRETMEIPDDLGDLEE